MVEAWQKLGLEQRVAAVAALLLAVSTFGPFSAVEAAELLVAAGVLVLLRQRALGKDFHLPFSDGTVLVVAGAWSAVLITARLLDRPFGQNMLALACAALLIAAGARLRIKHPPAPEDEPIEWDHSPAPPRKDPPRPPRPPSPSHAPTQQIPAEEEQTEPLPPPEFDPPRGR